MCRGERNEECVPKTYRRRTSSFFCSDRSCPASPGVVATLGAVLAMCLLLLRMGSGFALEAFVAIFVPGGLGFGLRTGERAIANFHSETIQLRVVTALESSTQRAWSRSLSCELFWRLLTIRRSPDHGYFLLHFTVSIRHGRMNEGGMNWITMRRTSLRTDHAFSASFLRGPNLITTADHL
jgi:hypothetical protein